MGVGVAVRLHPRAAAGWEDLRGACLETVAAPWWARCSQHGEATLCGTWVDGRLKDDRSSAESFALKGREPPLSSSWV